jgi:hypothetical protein
MKENDQTEERGNEFILPYQSPKIEKQIEILKAYCILSERGKKPVDYKEVAGLVGISDVIISGNHKFFVYSGFLKSVEGNYLPSDQLMEFINRLEWEKLKEAKKIIRKLFEKKWFFDYITRLLKLRGKMSEDDIINELGAKAGIERSSHYVRRLKRLLEWIKYAEIISESNDDNYELSQMLSDKEVKKSIEESERTKLISAPRIETSKETEFPLVLAINITPETTKDELKKMIGLAEDYLNEEYIGKGGDKIGKK